MSKGRLWICKNSHIAVAPTDANAIDAAVGGSFHVGVGVAHHDGLFFLDTYLVQHFFDNLRTWFVRKARTVAQDRHKGNVGEELLDKVLCSLLELVGSHGQQHPFVM